MKGAALGKVRLARRRRLTAWSAVAVIAFAVLVTVPPALAARSSSEAARALMIEGQRLLLSGEPAEAAGSFRAAQERFASARSFASTPGLRAVGVIPFAGRSADALRDLTQIGGLTAEAGISVADGLAALPEGMSSLAPRKGQIPVADIRSLAPAVTSAATSLDRAGRLAEALPDSWVLGPVATAANATKERVNDVLPLARSAAGLLENLPSFAGADGTRRYFVAAMNPAELRGTGGFIGVWSILTIRDGKLDLAKFRDIGELRDVPAGQVTAADPELTALYGKEMGSSWRATNLTPDAPTAAGLLESLWDRSHGEALDGVIFMDPEALAMMLDASGSVQVPELGQTLTGDNLVAFVTNDAYFRFEDDAGARKEALGLAGSAAWDNFLRGASPKAAVDAIVAATTGGHIVVHSTEASVQEAFHAAGITGEWRSTDSDFLGFVINNAAGNKVDFYTESDLAIDITLEGDRSATTRMVLSLRNGAPKHADPNEALGPYFSLPKSFGPGDNLSILQTYCSEDCSLNSATLDEDPLDVNEAGELDLAVFLSTFSTRPGEAHAIAYEFETPDAWQGSAAGGIYRLHLDGQQPVNATGTSLTINTPPGMRVTGASDELTVGANTVSWSGEVAAGQDFWVSFAKPPVQGGISRLWEFLTSPVG